MILFIFSTMLAFFCLGLGLLVYNRGRTKSTNLWFFSLTFFAAIWIISTELSDLTKSVKLSLFYTRTTLFSAVWAIFFFIRFAVDFPKVNVSLRNTFKWLVLLQGVISVLCYSNLFIASIQFEPWGSNPQLGVLVWIFLTYIAVVLVGGIFLLLRKISKSKGLERSQLNFVFLGTVVSSTIAFIISSVIPLFTDSASLAKIAPLSIIFLLVFISYTILKHRLLDIRIVVTRSIIYGLLVTAITATFVFLTVLSGQLFGNSGLGKVFTGIFVSLLIVLGLDPLKNILSNLTDNIFFKAKVDYEYLLQSLSNIVNIELNLQKLIDDLERGVIEGLKVKGALILLRDQEQGVTQKFRATDESGSNVGEVVIENDSALIQFLREHRHLSLLESLERKIEDTPDGSDKKQQEASRAEFTRIGAALVAPIFSQDHLVAILTLGPKLSGDSFSNDDTHLIEVLAPQIGSAIQKANLYEEVREFSEDLKIKVNDATKELRDRNVSLQTLQNITKDITRTLDFNKVVQNIANAVATELGFLGAILIFIDDDGKTLRARAVTETALTTKAIQLLPKPFSSYTTELTNPKHHTLAFDVITTGEVRYTDSMTEVISPPIPKPIVLAMQKLMGIKTMILVPITSEDRVIGVIEVGAKRNREAISDSEIETIQSMADELGVVARNISLFDRVRRTNDQLEQANAHLKQLDQAKSEFVSIASHQLRTPMTGIMGYLSMMTQGDFGKIKPEHQKILVDLLSESQRMIRLINQFLNVSKIEAGKFTYTWKPTQIEDLVEHVAKEVEKAAADKGLKLTVKYPKTKLPQIQADTDKVEDVILNLLDNAIKYTAKGTVTATVALDNGRVHFAVKDSGIGIKPQDATELFNKFVRGSGIAQIHPDGSGLGLFIAKSIIDAHGGRIWAESDGEGKGSTFQFSLPMKPPADEPAPLNPAAHVVGESTRPS